ncbi:DUF1488 family protein [Inquilinus limosus]|uniref:DUF1488 family protein n=1 Tax=Inquilinus limosus TaxID=171674 RepID=UPI00138B0C6A|nr:DUF1488 family protein [Inquilinus limosus]
MDEPVIVPAQVRAGRALLDWSQDTLARSANVGLSTVKDVESGKREPIAANLAAIRRALEDAGVVFIPPNGDGPGVRLRGRRAIVIRRPTKVAGEYLPFRVAWRGRKVIAFISVDALSDLAGADLATDEDHVRAFEAHQGEILDATSRAIDAERLDEDGYVRLGLYDLGRVVG